MQKLYINNNLYKLSIQNLLIASSNKLTHVFAQQSIIYELIGPLTGLLHVKYVDLSGNVFKFIKKTFFWHLSNLQHFNLSNNALSQTFEDDKHGELFMNQRLLSTLDLSFDRIICLPERLFQYNFNLRNLKFEFKFSQSIQC